MLELVTKEQLPQPAPPEIESRRGQTESMLEPDRESRLGKLALRLANRAYLGGIWLRHTLGIVAEEPPEDLRPKHSPVPLRTRTPEPVVPQPEDVNLWRSPNWMGEVLRPDKLNVGVNSESSSKAHPNAQPGDMFYYATVIGRTYENAERNRPVHNLLRDDSLEAMSSRLQRIRALSDLSIQASRNRDDPWVGETGPELAFYQATLETPSTPQPPITPPDPSYN